MCGRGEGGELYVNSGWYVGGGEWYVDGGWCVGRVRVVSCM